jgi:hypothetical protein
METMETMQFLAFNSKRNSMDWSNTDRLLRMRLHDDPLESLEIGVYTEYVVPTN